MKQKKSVGCENLLHGLYDSNSNNTIQNLFCVKCDIFFR